LRETRKLYKILFGKHEGTKSFGRIRRICEGNTKVDSGEIRLDVGGLGAYVRIILKLIVEKYSWTWED